LVNMAVIVSSVSLVAAVLKTRPCLGLPWLLSTLASLISDITTDIWLVKKAVFTPECSFLLTLELFIISLQMYSVYCVLHLFSSPPTPISPQTKLDILHTKYNSKYTAKMELSRISEESLENMQREDEPIQRKMSYVQAQIQHYPRRISFLENTKFSTTVV